MAWTGVMTVEVSNAYSRKKVSDSQISGNVDVKKKKMNVV